MSRRQGGHSPDTFTGSNLSITGSNCTYYDSAFSDYALAIRLSGPSGRSLADLGHLYSNISQIYAVHIKDYPKALLFLQKAVNYNLQHNNTRSLSFNYVNIADVYDKMGDPRRVLAFVNLTEYFTDLSESLLSSYGYDRHGFDLRVSTQEDQWAQASKHIK